MSASDKKPFPFFGGKILLLQPEKHKVSVDLIVFLSRLRGIKRNSKVLDLGAGFGFLSIVIALKFGCEVYALERDPQMLELLRENLRLNRLEEKVKVLEGDLRYPEKLFSRGFFDVVVANPPFYPKNFSPSPDPYHFESDTTLRDFVRTSSYALRDGGYLNLLIPAFRLGEAFGLLEKENLPPRFLSFVYPTLRKKARLVVVNAPRNRRGYTEVERPIIINEEDGSYTEEIQILLESFL
ncbi:MAG: methyltransferase [Aquificae bacterium]|nr:methyltransferase [Aquificota bacterium]